MKVSIIGAGGWGTALANQAAKNHHVILWAYSEEEAEKIRAKRENTDYLPGVKIAEGVEITSDPEIAGRADVWMFVTPSKYFREVARCFAPYAGKKKVLVSATKGFEYPSEKRMSRILEEEFPVHGGIAVMSGPTHAEEVGVDQPSSLVVASEQPEVAVRVQEAFSNPAFRVYTNDDVIGVEVSGSIKNVIAIAAGMLRGLGFGDNTQAALITRGLFEVKRLGLKLGAQEATFAGLAGMGDLIVTCVSPHSRNGRVGEMLAQGKKIEDILSGMKQVAEGVETVKTLIKFEEELGIELPISHAVYDVIYRHVDPLLALQALMLRPLKDERE